MLCVLSQGSVKIKTNRKSMVYNFILRYLKVINSILIQKSLLYGVNILVGLKNFDHWYSYIYPRRFTLITLGL